MGDVTTLNDNHDPGSQPDPRVPACPSCGSGEVATARAKTFGDPRWYACGACGQLFSTPVPPVEWACLLAAMCGFGVGGLTGVMVAAAAARSGSMTALAIAAVWTALMFGGIWGLWPSSTPPRESRGFEVTLKDGG